MLAAYVTKQFSAHFIKKTYSFKQALGVFAALLPKRIYNKLLKSGIVYEKTQVKLLFLEGLHEPICNNMRVHFGQHPRAPIVGLDRFSNMLIKIADRSVSRSESS